MRAFLYATLIGASLAAVMPAHAAKIIRVAPECEVRCYGEPVRHRPRFRQVHAAQATPDRRPAVLQIIEVPGDPAPRNCLGDMALHDAHGWSQKALIDIRQLACDALPAMRAKQPQYTWKARGNYANAILVDYKRIETAVDEQHKRRVDGPQDEGLPSYFVDKDNRRQVRTSISYRLRLPVAPADVPHGASSVIGVTVILHQ